MNRRRFLEVLGIGALTPLTNRLPIEDEADEIIPELTATNPPVSSSSSLTYWNGPGSVFYHPTLERYVEVKEVTR